MYPEVKHIIGSNVTLSDLDRVARALIQQAGNYRILVFQGEMGAGKTTLIKAIGRALGVTDTMSSPTFSIVNEYQTQTGDHVFHFDFYRLKNEMEAYDIGTEEYLDSGHYCLIEWPDKIASLLRGEYVEVSIEKTPGTEQSEMRTITFTIHD